jgi:alkylation response protein AidB-like acyl-CoA dehydrogenase
MSATDLTIDLRDIRFVLFEQLKIDEVLQKYEQYADFDRDIYDSMLEEGAKICTEVVAPINAPGDRVGCKLDDKGNVTTPPGYKEAWDAVAEGGWGGMTGSPEYGGMGLPPIIGAVFSEMLIGACTAFSIYQGLTHGAADLIQHFGPDWLKDACLEKMFACEWGGTMCLTEAGAGTDVGANRCKATPTDEDGVYLLEGEKVFISGGDQDMSENIIHLVLARLPDAPAGTKGLSIFAVPKFDFNTGDRNGAFVVGIEHKMGINGSATCTLALGADTPCRGYIVGQPGDGIRIMFHLMNDARIKVGLQGLGSAAAAYQNALSYAKERVQSASLKDMRNPDAQPVTIINHPDVRRMLMRMKVATETMRSMLYVNGLRLTLSDVEPDEAAARTHKNSVDLMVPICKAHCSDLGFEVTATAVQVFGGYGYIQEYPVEQHLRDNKIASIYEGTNGVQAMDLLGRKMRQGQGVLFMQWLQETNELLERAKAVGAFDGEIAALEKARDGVGAAAMHLAGQGRKDIEGAMLYASPFLEAFGTVELGAHALRQAIVAKAALDAGGVSEADRKFYKGKLLNLSFYVAHFLPKATALSKTIRSTDVSCMDEDLFV